MCRLQARDHSLFHSCQFQLNPIHKIFKIKIKMGRATSMRQPRNPIPDLKILRHLRTHLNHDTRGIASKERIRRSRFRDFVECLPICWIQGYCDGADEDVSGSEAWDGDFGEGGVELGGFYEAVILRSHCLRFIGGLKREWRGNILRILLFM